LWKNALRIEDGEFAMVGRELSNIQDLLEAAMRDGDYTDAVEELLNSLSAALERFLASFGKQLNDKAMEGLWNIPGLSHLDAANLKRMIEDAQDLARTRSMDAAQATLDELRSLLQSIETAPKSNQTTDQFREIRKLMESFSGMSRDQQGLLDQTFQQMRPTLGGEANPKSKAAADGTQLSPNEGAPGDMTRSYAPAQDALRHRLGELRAALQQLLGRQFPAIGNAATAMGRATDSLRSADPSGAVGHQTGALQALSRAKEQMIEQISRHLQAMPGTIPASQGSMPNTDNDPFRRMGSGAAGAQMNDGSVKVPSHMQMRRAREIYEELRCRAGNLKRPVLEREYIHRLLRQF
jgi:hypothetical protein